MSRVISPFSSPSWVQLSHWRYSCAAPSSRSATVQPAGSRTENGGLNTELVKSVGVAGGDGEGLAGDGSVALRAAGVSCATAREEPPPHATSSTRAVLATARFRQDIRLPLDLGAGSMSPDRR